MFKNTKKALAFAVAFAIVVTSLFTGLSVSADCSTRTTIYWDGTVADGISKGSGEKADPYVISTASELAWLIQQNVDISDGKHFELDKTIGAIVLQPEAYGAAIKSLTDAAAVKSYFKANAANMMSWVAVGYEQSAFCGSFDGNGVTVYGLYQAASNNAGLFSNVDAGAVIKNIGLKNSYLTTTSDNCQVGGLAAASNGTDSGAKADGTIRFDSCVVANNYIYNPSGALDSTGVIAGKATGDTVCIDNCLVYGNDAAYEAVPDSVNQQTQNQQPEWKSHPEDYKLLAFTFDDGPSSKAARLVELFTLYEGTGTFFVRGNSISGSNSYSIMQSAINAGWDIGNHGDTHMNAQLGGAGGGEVTYDQINADINNLTAKLEGNLKARDGSPYRVRFYRAPNIKPTSNTFKVCTEQNLAVVWLEHDSMDWSSSNTYNSRYNIFKNGIGTWNDGDVILCHEHGTVGSDDTYNILVELLPEFYEAGYRFCSISELMELRGITQSQVSGELKTNASSKGMITNVLDDARDKTASVVADADGVLVTDSIVFDAPAFNYAQNERYDDLKLYQNVLTNIEFEQYAFLNGKVFNAIEEQVKVVADLKDAELPSAFVKTADMPELRSFHDSISVGAAGHKTLCSCGLEDTTVLPHTYDNQIDTDCNVCGETRVPAWEISVDTTGVYTILPNEAYTADFDLSDIAVLDANGNAVVYNEKLGGYTLVKNAKYSIEFVELKLENINGELVWNVGLENTKLFPDTNAGDWYSDAVAYSVGAGILKGYDNGKFGTSDQIQRQDFIVMLARYAGVDLTAYEDDDCEFVDVPDGSYYEAAINWAYSEGITTGYSDGSGKFGVGDKMTREQIVTFLYRYAQKIGVDTTVDEQTAAEVIAQYGDFAAVTDFAEDAIVWALANDVISGQGGVAIDPQGGAQRCQVAQIMYNIFKSEILAI